MITRRLNLPVDLGGFEVCPNVEGTLPEIEGVEVCEKPENGLRVALCSFDVEELSPHLNDPLRTPAVLSDCGSPEVADGCLSASLLDSTVRLLG